MSLTTDNSPEFTLTAKDIYLNIISGGFPILSVEAADKSIRLRVYSLLHKALSRVLVYLVVVDL